MQSIETAILETTKNSSRFLKMLPQVDGRFSLVQSQILIECPLAEFEIAHAYLGKHTGLDIPVVVRVMRSEVRGILGDFEHFREGSRRMARVRHPSAAAIFDMGDVEGNPYLVHEYISGVPLMERIKLKALDFDAALKVMVPIGEALLEFWRHGIVYRTVSPEFIYLQCDGRVKLDLPLVCPRDTVSRNAGVKRLMAYATKRCLPYWSPEEIRGEAVSPAADMWSFGATLYQAVTGSYRFRASPCRRFRKRFCSKIRSIRASMCRTFRTCCAI